MAWAPGCVWDAGLARILGARSYRGPGQAPFPTPAALLFLGLPGTSAGREHTLHQPLHSKEIHSVGVHMSAQLPQVLALGQSGVNVGRSPGWG